MYLRVAAGRRHVGAEVGLVRRLEAKPKCHHVHHRPSPPTNHHSHAHSPVVKRKRTTETRIRLERIERNQIIEPSSVSCSSSNERKRRASRTESTKVKRIRHKTKRATQTSTTNEPIRAGRVGNRNVVELVQFGVAVGVDAFQRIEHGRKTGLL